MASTDFVDDDLVRKGDGGRRVKTITGDGNIPPSSELPVRPVSDFNLTRMARQKQEVDDQMAGAAQQLERLRKRQDELEKEKRFLEDVRRKQEDYDHGKREMFDRLNESLIKLEKEQVQGERLVELLGETRKRFKTMLAEIEKLNEELWPEDHLLDELNRALTVLDETRMEYNKSMARIDAIGGGGSGAVSAPGDHKPLIFEEHHSAHEQERSFGYWFKVGLAVSLPLVATLVILAFVLSFMHGNGFF